QVKFVGHDGAGLPVKRKQVQQACSSCRKKKKACPHAPDSLVRQKADLPSISPRIASPKRRRIALAQAASDASSQAPLFSQDPDHSDHSDLTDNNTPGPDPTSPVSMPTFIGDTNPESVLVDASMASIPEIRDHSHATSVGVWAPRNVQPRNANHETGTGVDDSHPSGEPRSASFRSDRARAGLDLPSLRELDLVAAREQYLRALAQELRPSETAWKAAKTAYLHSIHPFLPILDKSRLDSLELSSNNDGVAIDDLIIGSVCLATARHLESGHHLPTSYYQRQSHKTAARKAPEDPAAAYNQKMAKFVNDAWRHVTPKEPHRHLSDVLSVLGLTCLFWQPRAADRSAPSDLFSAAVSMVHTHGFHLRRSSGRAQDSNDHLRLFRCLYAVDRLLAAFNGRPVMFHNHDIDRYSDLDEIDTSPSFKLFMSVVFQLDYVIELYRPQPKIPMNVLELETLEYLILKVGAQFESDTVLATIEVLYHAVSLLSVRMDRSCFANPPEEDSVGVTRRLTHLPPSTLNARRSWSADRILELIRDRSPEILPFVPYALSLSLSVAYRKWRFSRVPMFRARGRATFQEILSILNSFGQLWTSARINSGLAKMVLTQLKKAEDHVKSRKGEEPDAPERPGRDHTNDSTSQRSTTESEPWMGDRGRGQGTASPDNTTLQSISDSSVDAAALTRQTGQQPPRITTGAGIAPPLSYGPSVLDDASASDFDLFQFCDQDFPLFAFDESFSSNLDPGCTLSWSDFCNPPFFERCENPATWFNLS
ncbi:hypothetical protein QBC46DRAFT_438400, partial [Diplogelasinospora grovesii]